MKKEFLFGKHSIIGFGQLTSSFSTPCLWESFNEFVNKQQAAGRLAV
jgi:hypothetical protein